TSRGRGGPRTCRTARRARSAYRSRPRRRQFPRPRARRRPAPPGRPATRARARAEPAPARSTSAVRAPPATAAVVPALPPHPGPRFKLAQLCSRSYARLMTAALRKIDQAPFSQQLREATREDHDRANQSAFVTKILDGSARLSAYTALAVQHFHIST